MNDAVARGAVRALMRGRRRQQPFIEILDVATERGAKPQIVVFYYRALAAAWSMLCVLGLLLTILGATAVHRFFGVPRGTALAIFVFMPGFCWFGLVDACWRVIVATASYHRYLMWGPEKTPWPSGVRIAQSYDATLALQVIGGLLAITLVLTGVL
jgi:hypothetical protein